MPTLKKRVEASELPVEQIIILGSGILDALGLREARDLDAIVEPSLFEALQAAGEYDCGVKDGDRYCRATGVELWHTWFGRTYDQVLTESVVIDDLRYGSIEATIADKLRLGRDKDLADIKLLENYLERQH